MKYIIIDNVEVYFQEIHNWVDPRNEFSLVKTTNSGNKIYVHKTKVFITIDSILSWGEDRIVARDLGEPCVFIETTSGRYTMVGAPEIVVEMIKESQEI